MKNTLEKKDLINTIPGSQDKMKLNISADKNSESFNLIKSSLHIKEKEFNYFSYPKAIEKNTNWEE